MNASAQHFAPLDAEEKPPEVTACDLIARSREAQKSWAQRSIRERVDCLRKFRHLLVEEVSGVLNPLKESRGVSPAEIVVSEIVPLADACKFLESEAGQILHPRQPQGRRPFWLSGTTLTIHREPLGVVLILGPSNYPLLIVGVQLLQAIVAGNAVLVKPGRGCGKVVQAMQALLSKAGIDRDLLTVLDDNDELKVRRIIAEGVDKILLTGSSAAGAPILEAAAKSLTPATLELSGCDAVFVLQGADPALAAKALAFGLLLNRSRTCMRPHRVLVHESVRDRLVEHLGREFGKLDADAKPWQLDLKSSRMLADALDTGARIVMGSSDDPFRFPMVLENVDPTSELGQTDSFLPVLILHTFAEIKHALRIYDLCPYALGASVFGPEANAEKLSKKINAGFVIINDIIAPTADPRLPFSGRKLSGFGITRGAEGLLELTRVKAVCKRNSNYRHLGPLQPADKNFFLAYLQLAHGPWRKRFSAALNLIRAAAQRSRTSSRISSQTSARPNGQENRTGQ